MARWSRWGPESDAEFVRRLMRKAELPQVESEFEFMERLDRAEGYVPMSFVDQSRTPPPPAPQGPPDPKVTIPTAVTTTDQEAIAREFMSRLPKKIGRTTAWNLYRYQDPRPLISHSAQGVRNTG